MALEKPQPAAMADNWVIPRWMRYAATVFLLGWVAIFVRAVVSAQKAILGLSPAAMAIFALFIIIFSGLFQVSFWFFPKSRLALALYWLLRFLKGPICVFSALGLVYVFTIRAPVISLRGAGTLFTFIFIFLMGIFTQPVGQERYPFPELGNFFAQLNATAGRINTFPRWILGLLVAILSALIVCCVIYFGLHARLSDYRPYSIWNDETGYWLWVRMFSRAGLNVGYNAPNELLARAGFNHYGEGSPLFVYFYGMIGQLVGWSPQLPLLINFALFSLAIFAFIYFTRLENTQTIWVGLVTTLTWPVLVYLLLTTHETLNQAIGIILAIIFFALLTNREKVSLPLRVLYVFLIYVATLVRLSWGLMLIPALFYSLNGTVSRRSFFSIFLGLGLYVSAIFLTGYLVPPVNNSIFLSVRGSFVYGPQVLLLALWNQFKALFKMKQMTPNIAVVFQIFVIISWNLVRLIKRIRSKTPLVAILESRVVFDIYNMGMLILAGLMFYLQVAFYRTFAPSMLVIYLLQVAKKDYKLLGTLLLINVAFFSAYMNFYLDIGDAQIIKTDFTAKFPQLTQSQAKLEKLLVYDPATKNPWCNTLLIPLDYYDYRLTIVPPGIGISYILDPREMQYPVKSQYLLLDQETYQNLADKLHVEILDSLPIGDLYRNLDASCDAGK